MLEVPTPDDLISDPQLKGRAKRMMASKEFYNPARPLKASELAAMEKGMVMDLGRSGHLPFGFSDFCSLVKIQMV